MNNKVLLDVDIDGSCIYDVSPLSSPEYQAIEKSPKSLITSIIMKSKWYDDYESDLDDYYYSCNRGECKDYLVYYFDREEHMNKYHSDECCIIL